MEYEKDKVYLQDTRNGRVYNYEPILAKASYIQQVVLNPSEKKKKVVPQKDESEQATKEE